MRTSGHFRHVPFPVGSGAVFLGTLVFWASGTGRIDGQPNPLPRQEVWRPDGPVLAAVIDGETAYVGGSFGYLGPASGSAGVVQREGAAVAGDFPVLDGTVWAMTEDGRGGWFVGGAFTERVTRQARLLRVRADGSVDPEWRPAVQGTVRALWRDGAALYVAGSFSQVNGESRSGLVRFDFPSGGLAAWNPAPNDEVHALAGDGSRLYVGGLFTSLSRQSRARIAAFDLGTGELAAFNPGVSGSGAIVRALALSGSTLFVGGEFTTCGGKPRTRLAALNTEANTGNALDWNPGAGDDVYSLRVAGSRVFAGGGFTTIGGANRARIAALEAGSNAAVPGWDPGANGIVYALALDGDGVLAGGAFTVLGGQPRSGVGRIDSGTGVVTDWIPRLSVLSSGGNPAVAAVAVAGEVVGIAGTFASLGGVARSRLAAVDLASGEPTAWDPGANGDVLSLALSDAAVFVGGRFTQVAGAARTRLASIDRGTGAVNAFTANVVASGNNGVTALLFAGIRLYLGGTFSSVNGVARVNLAEVHAGDGVLNTTWNPAPNGGVHCLALEGTNLYVGGAFNGLGGSNRIALGAVSTSGTGRATAWQPRADDDVRALVLAGNRLHVGGDFESIGGAPRRRLAVLDTVTGDADVAWNPDVAAGSGTFYVQTLAVSGRVAYAGGAFSSAGGEFRERLAGIHRADGTATVWNPGANALVRRILIGSDCLVIGGDFTQVGGANVAYLAVFSARPSIPVGGLRFGAGGTPEVTVWDGELTSDTIAVEGANGAGGEAWIEVGAASATGRPRAFPDPGATGRSARCYRAVRR